MLQSKTDSAVAPCIHNIEDNIPYIVTVTLDLRKLKCTTGTLRLILSVNVLFDYILCSKSSDNCARGRYCCMCITILQLSSVSARLPHALMVLFAKACIL